MAQAQFPDDHAWIVQEGDFAFNAEDAKEMQDMTTPEFSAESLSESVAKTAGHMTNDSEKRKEDWGTNDGVQEECFSVIQRRLANLFLDSRSARPPTTCQ